MKRIVFKISGEVFKEDDHNINYDKILEVANNIKKLYDRKIQMILVCGAGNLFRGRSSEKMNKTNADNIGMLGTSMNTIALYDALNYIGVPTEMYNSFNIDGIINTYNINICLKDLENGKVIIVGGGSRLPLCSTDFACVQRAIELNANAIFLGKSVDGIYDKDPKKYPDAKKIDKISSVDVLKNHINNGVDGLGIMDITAESLLAKYNMGVYVFDITSEDSIDKILSGENIGSIIV